MRKPTRYVQPPDAENRTSGGVGGCRGAILGTRPDRICRLSRRPLSKAAGSWRSERRTGLANPPTARSAPVLRRSKVERDEGLAYSLL